MSNQHKKDPGAGKPKFRKNWKNWQEDASRVKDRPGYKAKIAKIFGHECELCGGEKLAQIYVHTKECPNHPDNVAEFERQLEERLDAGMGPPCTKPMDPVLGLHVMRRELDELEDLLNETDKRLGIHHENT